MMEELKDFGSLDLEITYLDNTKDVFKSLRSKFRDNVYSIEISRSENIVIPLSSIKKIRALQNE